MHRASNASALPSKPHLSPNKVQKAAADKAEIQKVASEVPGQKTSQETSVPDAQKRPGGLFGAIGSKTQPDTLKTTESVTGKMFGFGSSVFSSASTLLTSSAQEESSATPPGSRKMSGQAQGSRRLSTAPKISPNSTPAGSPKMSPSKEAKPPTAQMLEGEKKPEQPQQAKASPSVQAKVDKAPSEPPKAAASQAAPKAGQSTCPLCKVGLNMGSKDPPNYNTCTDCKNAVCNQCGFNPQPNVAEVSTFKYLDIAA